MTTLSRFSRPPLVRWRQRLQEEAAARHRDLTPRLLESIEWQREGLAVGRQQLETLQKLLEEIRALRADLKNR